MNTSKISPRFVEKEVKTVESVRDGVTLNLTDKEARFLIPLIGKAVGAELEEVYGALVQEYPGSPFQIVYGVDGKHIVAIKITGA